MEFDKPPAKRFAGSVERARGTWTDQIGFLFAATGSAVGLGNIWKFPHVAARNGGGTFVLVYLIGTALVAVPLLVAELIVGRASESSPVRAFRAIAGRGTDWVGLGWLAVLAGFLVLSFYSVVAGWALHYLYLAATNAFAGRTPAEISDLFFLLQSSPLRNVVYHGLFMGLTVAVVIGGVQGGIERWARVLMPGLFIVLLMLLVYAVTLPGFGEAMTFVFRPRLTGLSAPGVLEALSQGLLSLTLGTGVMITYGSYLDGDAGIPGASLWIAGLDLLIALLAAAIVFPIVYSTNLGVESDVGLVFQTLPVAFSQIRAGWPLGALFFLLLVLSAVTSSISLLEVVTSNFVDLYGWDRRQVCIGAGIAVFVAGLPSALSAGQGLYGAGLWQRTGRTFLMWIDHVACNWLLPLAGILLALFVGHVMDPELRRREFCRSSDLSGLHDTWRLLVRFAIPATVLVVLLHSTGILDAMGRFF
jgi:NSS family neurotransmitter:Na+ symporter